jgi:hypothetical protein
MIVGRGEEQIPLVVVAAQVCALPTIITTKSVERQTSTLPSQHRYDQCNAVLKLPY